MITRPSRRAPLKQRLDNPTVQQFRYFPGFLKNISLTEASSQSPYRSLNLGQTMYGSRGIHPPVS
jgi:hypothetical protein